ncbi:MAG: exonuclease domain-containing protein [Clostridiales bacterium]|nr:exonuclease domain-containing protein [Clostridiales bacterium]
MYVVLDLEFNQAYDFVNNTKGEPKPNCRFEIIQIGAIKLNDNFEIVDSFNKLIKPQIYKRIHPHVQKITGFSDNDFINCLSFTEIYSDFLKFLGNGSYIMCTWGNSDIRALYRNLTYYNLITPPTLIKYIDVQNIATKYLNYDRGGAIGLKNAIDMLNIKTGEFFHNAYYDALYTTEVFKIVKPEKIQLKLFNSKRIK